MSSILESTEIHPKEFSYRPHLGQTPQSSLRFLGSNIGEPVFWSVLCQAYDKISDEISCEAQLWLMICTMATFKRSTMSSCRVEVIYGVPAADSIRRPLKTIKDRADRRAWQSIEGLLANLKRTCQPRDGQARGSCCQSGA